MGMPPLPKKGFHEIDWRVGFNVLVGALCYFGIVALIPAASNYLNLCILTICCAFLADINWKTTWKNGVVRVCITSIGAVMAIIPVAVFDLTQSEAILLIVFALVGVCVLVVTKYLNVMYIQVRLALVAYILTVYTIHGGNYAAMGKTGYVFCITWVLSTVLGVVICVAATWLWDTVKKLAAKPENKAE